MTKEILLQISGIQFLTEEIAAPEEPVEVFVHGSYLKKGDCHYIHYDETLEGQEGEIRNLIKISGGCMEVVKKGATEAHMVFEEKKKTTTYYSTPFGSLQIGVMTTRLEVREETDRMDVKAEYALEINETFIADCSLSICVRSRVPFS